MPVRFLIIVFLVLAVLPACSPSAVVPTTVPTSNPTVAPTAAVATPVAPTQVLPTPTRAPTVAAAATPSAAYRFVWKLPINQAPLRNAGIAETDAQGNLYLLTADEQVVKMDPEGNVLLSFGEPGSGPGQLLTYHDVTTPLYPDPVAGGDIAVATDGTIYVADGGNFRVQFFSPQGKFLGMFGKQGQGDREFQVPWAITTDPDNNLYVGDFTGTIQKFDPAGKFLARFGKGIGFKPGQFGGAVTDLETDAAGNIYAADRKSGRIQKFDPDGNFVLQWDQCGGALLDFRGLDVSADGTVFVSTRGGQKVCIYDTNGKLITTFGAPGLRDGEFLFGDFSLDLVVDAAGAVYVSDSAGERLQKFERVTNSQ